MKTVTRIGLMTLAVLGFSTVALASLIVEVDAGVPVDGLMSYTVHLVADTEADKATAWDGSFDGPMNHLLAAGVLPTPTMTNASFLGADIVLDSHFLLADDELLIADAPTESGTHLDGSFGIKPGSATMDLSFAQIVIAPGNVVTMTGIASNDVGTKFDTNVVIPEPVTLSVLALGGLLAGLRRRR